MLLCKTNNLARGIQGHQPQILYGSASAKSENHQNEVADSIYKQHYQANDQLLAQSSYMFYFRSISSTLFPGKENCMVEKWYISTTTTHQLGKSYLILIIIREALQQKLWHSDTAQKVGVGDEGHAKMQTACINVRRGAIKPELGQRMAIAVRK